MAINYPNRLTGSFLCEIFTVTTSTIKFSTPTAFRVSRCFLTFLRTSLGYNPRVTILMHKNDFKPFGEVFSRTGVGKALQISNPI